MITVKELMESSTTVSTDGGLHWEPLLPAPHFLARVRFLDAWEVFRGRATAIRNTKGK